MDLHSIITDELFKNKSIAAFIWLICQGRELEFSYNEMEAFISKDNSKSFVSLWINSDEQDFKSMEELFENATVEGQKLCNIWENVVLGYLF